MTVFVCVIILILILFIICLIYAVKTLMMNEYHLVDEIHELNREIKHLNEKLYEQ